MLDGYLKDTLQKGRSDYDKERWKTEVREKYSKLLNSMRDMEVKPDSVCYTALIDWHCKIDDLQDAHKLFDEMIEKGLTPDAYTYTTLISGYCNKGNIEKAEGLVEEMLNKGIQPSSLTFSILDRGSLCSKSLQIQ